MYHIAICEEEEKCAIELQRILKEIFLPKSISYQIDLFLEHAAFAAKIIKNPLCYPLVFLDTVFQEKSGIEIADMLRKQGMNSALVFLADTPELAFSSYQVAPVHYLLKPLDPKEVAESVRRATTKEPSGKYVLINFIEGLEQLDLASIRYIEIFNHTAIFHLEKGERVSEISLKELEQKISTPKFVRCHKSYLVNLEHVLGVVRYELKLDNRETVPIGKQRYQEVQESFKEYVKKKNFPVIKKSEEVSVL